jgi:hypothetical protein
MSSKFSDEERPLLESVASSYEVRGYSVKLLPAGKDLPDFLTGLKPDLIATRKDESLVVEVKHRTELGDEQIQAIEAAVATRPGWRFELIIDGSSRERDRILAAPDVVALIEEANGLHETGHLAAGLLLLWSAIEGVLRQMAAHEAIELASPAPKYLITRLYTLGLVSKEQYRILDDAIRSRNQAAHGFQVSISHQELLALTSIARQLLSDLESKAA